MLVPGAGSAIAEVLVEESLDVVEQCPRHDATVLAVVDFFTEPLEQYTKFIGPETPIASMGSCFAVEIQAWLLERNFNYIRTEES